MEYLLKRIEEAKRAMLDPGNPEHQKIIEENMKRYGDLLGSPSKARDGWQIETPYIIHE